jgi:hypothetical protein
MRHRVRLLGPVLILAVAGAAGWLWYTRVGDPPLPPPWTDDIQAIADGNNCFALDLYAKLREGETGNLLFSPSYLPA